ncbi:MAG: hypothetical protein KIH69_005510 [Anaerolineae bacterium]|nr:hypothetical protein [Anaerolineae bacterium]
MKKIGLRIIGVSVLLTLVFIGIAIGLAQWRQSILENASPINFDTASADQLAAIAVRFDTNGIGTQVIDNTAMTFKLAPYPIKANTPTTLTLIPLDTRSTTLTVITPTLLISPQDAASASPQTIQRQNDGTYRAYITLPQTGQWRLRLNYAMGSKTGYSVLMLIEAK